MHEKDINFMKNISNGKMGSITEQALMRQSEIAIESFFDSHFKEHFDNLNFSNTKKVIFSKEMRL